MYKLYFAFQGQGYTPLQKTGQKAYRFYLRCLRIPHTAHSQRRRGREPRGQSTLNHLREPELLLALLLTVIPVEFEEEGNACI
jgi:hypothetical protein